MRIFIASSSELNQERKELQLLLYRNNIEPVVWEDIDHSIGTDRFQTRINEEHLLTSDFVVFMIKSKLGQFTLEEFEEAYKSLGSKIEGMFIYFFEFDKNILNDDELFKILSLEIFLKKEGKYPQKVKDFRDLENHFLEKIKHLKPSISNESTKTLETEVLEQQTPINQI